MGGFGSGKRAWKKTTVEQCWTLDAARLYRQGVLADQGFAGTGRLLTWTNNSGERTLALTYWVESVDSLPSVLNIHSILGRDGTETVIDEPIRLASTCPHFGGLRWWFLCPLAVNGVACERRVRKLYLQRGGQYFGCRSCYELTYESAQTHDHRVDDLLRKPIGLIAALNSKNPREALFGLRAYLKLYGFVKMR